MSDISLDLSHTTDYIDFLSRAFKVMGYHVISLEENPERKEIEGAISTDVLGFEQIAVHALITDAEKKVSRLQLMASASLLGDVKKAVYVSLSGFDREAQAWARNCPHAKIVLLDKDFLCKYQ